MANENKIVIYNTDFKQFQQKLKRIINGRKMETWGCAICGAQDTLSKKEWQEQLSGDLQAGFTGLICGNITCSGFWEKVEPKK